MIRESPIEEEEEEEEEEDEEEESEEEAEVEYDGIGRRNLPELGIDDIYEEEQKLREETQTSKVSLDDLKSGIQSLIQGSSSLATPKTEEIIKKPARPPTMPPLPIESARPLYEILPEVKVQGGSSSEIYGSSHTYAISGNSVQPPSSTQGVVNISKNIDITKPITTSDNASTKEDEKKK